MTDLAAPVPPANACAPPKHIYTTLGHVTALVQTMMNCSVSRGVELNLTSELSAVDSFQCKLLICHLIFVQLQTIDQYKKGNPR